MLSRHRYLFKIPGDGRPPCHTPASANEPLAHLAHRISVTAESTVTRAICGYHLVSHLEPLAPRSTMQLHSAHCVHLLGSLLSSVMLSYAVLCCAVFSRVMCPVVSVPAPICGPKIPQRSHINMGPGAHAASLTAVQRLPRSGFATLALERLRGWRFCHFATDLPFDAQHLLCCMSDR